MIKRLFTASFIFAMIGICAPAMAQQPPQRGQVQCNATGAYQCNLSVFSGSLTPGATSAAIQTSTQTFTITGLLVGDIVWVNGPAPTSLCPNVAARVSSLNTLALDFSVLTAAACTPAAGAYTILDLR